MSAEVLLHSVILWLRDLNLVSAESILHPATLLTEIMSELRHSVDSHVYSTVSAYDVPLVL